VRALNDFALAPHFRLYEFECRCCGRVTVASVLPEMLEELRGAWGRPLAITSGYRCASHNAAVGGAPRSLHMAGRAVDIRASVSEQAKLKTLALVIGFYEILPGNIKNYIHLACK
jgi:hypothetical protein